MDRLQSHFPSVHSKQFQVTDVRCNPATQTSSKIYVLGGGGKGTLDCFDGIVPILTSLGCLQRNVNVKDFGKELLPEIQKEFLRCFNTPFNHRL